MTWAPGPVHRRSSDEIAGTLPFKLLEALEIDEAVIEDMPSPRELASEFDALLA
jgi:hypothetical protein